MALIINPYRFASAFDPASLFQGGTYKGFWIDASDTATLKQDTGGSTAVTADSDPVGYVAQKSGGGGVFTRFTDDTRRPLYKVVSGYSCLRFDGSNDGLQADATVRAFSANMTVLTVIVAAKADAGASYPTYMMDGYWSNYHGTICRFDTSTTVQLWSHNDGAHYASATPTTKALYTFILYQNNTSPSRKIRVNGSSVYSSGSAETTAFGTGSAQVIGVGTVSDNSGGWFNGDIYQMFAINRELTGTDLTSAEQALAAKAGITI